MEIVSDITEKFQCSEYTIKICTCGGTQFEEKVLNRGILSS